MGRLTQERYDQIRSAVEDGTVDKELLDEIDALRDEEAAATEASILCDKENEKLRSDFEEGKARNDRMAAALSVLSQISMCKACGVYNQNIIDQIDEMTKEKV